MLETGTVTREPGKKHSYYTSYGYKSCKLTLTMHFYNTFRELQINIL